jgi:hypothetical protein
LLAEARAAVDVLALTPVFSLVAIG